MIALSVDSAKNIAIGAAGVFVVFSLLSAWIIKNIVGKIIMIVLMVGLALGAWTQRTSLQECADKAKAAAQAGNTSLDGVTCKFFGTEVKL
jgi:protein-S-isoprenylcysteine O-methyltransferase Ste14